MGRTYYRQLILNAIFVACWLSFLINYFQSDKQFQASSPETACSNFKEEGAKVYRSLSLPNATVVEFTVHGQTRLQSKFKGTDDSCLFLTIIRDANLCSLFKNVQGT